VPVIAGLFFDNNNPKAAMGAMVSGGSVTAGLSFFEVGLPLGLDPNCYGILVSLSVFWTMNKLKPLKTNLL
jgi:SSS family solute:Na+ symporter